MANYIGPVTLDIPHIREDDEIKPDGSEVINLVCSSVKAKQLLGLGGDVVKNQYGPVRIIKGKNDRWGLVPVNTSDNLKINEGNPHKGFYVLGNPQESYLNPNVSRVTIEAELISRNLNEILTMHYTRGGEDGTDIEHSYEDLTPAYIINESGADFDTTNDWFAASKYRMANGAIASSGGQIVFSGGADTDGVPGQVWTNHRTQFDHGFIMEFTLYPGNKPTAGNKDKDINVWFSPNRSSSTPPVWNDSYLISLGVSSTNQYYQIHTIGSPGGGSWWCLKPITVDNTPTAFKFRLTTDNKYYMKVELSRYVSGAWTAFSEVFYGPTNLGAWSDFYMGVYYLNRDSTSNSMSISDIKVYNYLESDKPNVVVLPPDAIPNKTPDFYRASEEGNIQCFKNLSESLNFQIDPLNYYKGSVKGLNSNYTDSVPRLVTHNEVDLSIGKFNFTNGIIKLVPTSNGVEMYYWDGTSYILVNTFTFNHLTRLIRPYHVSKDVFTLQLDRTFWTLRAGKPFVYVEHPNDDIGFTKNISCYHDGVINNGLAADADVSMLTQFYSLHFNPHNLLTTNTYGVEEGLDGFYDESSTLERVSGASYGTYHLKCTSKNLQATEGVYLDEVSLLTGNNTGLIFGGRVYLKGTGTWKLLITERKSDDTALNTTSSAPFTLTSTPSVRNIFHTVISSEAEKLNLMIYTDGQQSAEFYGDVFQLAPSPVANQTIYPIPPLTANRYGMLIMKKDPTTIKSDSIPASEITGIGVYDQLQPPNSNDYYLQLAREFYRPTRQAIGLQGV